MGDEAATLGHRQRRNLGSVGTRPARGRPRLASALVGATCGGNRDGADAWGRIQHGTASAGGIGAASTGRDLGGTGARWGRPAGAEAARRLDRGRQIEGGISQSAPLDPDFCLIGPVWPALASVARF